MLKLIISTFWLFLPAGIANMSPVLFKWLPFLNYPVDFYQTCRQKRIFGDHKTFRGLVVGIMMAIITVYLQKKFPTAYALIDYNKINTIYLGVLLGGGALLGDLIKSFFKRQFNVLPGLSWMPYDQLDWIIGALVAISIYQLINWKIWLIALFFAGILHPLVNIFGYYLGVKRNKF